MSESPHQDIDQQLSRLFSQTPQFADSLAGRVDAAIAQAQRAARMRPWILAVALLLGSLALVPYAGDLAGQWVAWVNGLMPAQGWLEGLKPVLAPEVQPLGSVLRSWLAQNLALVISTAIMVVLGWLALDA